MRIKLDTQIEKQKLPTWRIVLQGAWLGVVGGIVASLLISIAVLAWESLGLKGDSNFLDIIESILVFTVIFSFPIAFIIISPFSLCAGITIALLLEKKPLENLHKIGIRIGAIVGAVFGLVSFGTVEAGLWKDQVLSFTAGTWYSFFSPLSLLIFIIGALTGGAHGWLTARWLEKKRALQEPT